MLIAERAEWVEKIANSAADTLDTQQRIGRCKGLKWTLDKINEQIRSLNSGDEPKTD